MSHDMFVSEDNTFTLEQYQRSTDAPEPERRLYVSVEVVTVPDRDWGHEAACIPHDGSWWFPGRDVASIDNGRKARAICRSCPVRVPCVVEAVKVERLTYCGIRGGFSTPDLYRLRDLLRRGVTIDAETLDRLEFECVRCGNPFVKRFQNQRTCGKDCPGPAKPAAVEMPQRDTTPVPLPNGLSHGSRWAYDNYYCRCDKCRATVARLRRESRKGRAS